MPGAREIAFLSLEACEKQKKYSNLEIDAKIKKYGLKGAEKGLYVSLLYGVIERKLTLDYIASVLSSRPLEKLDLGVLNAIRLGLYQLIYMDKIPQSAAVDESVKLAVRYVGRSTGGYVNAVLRGFLRSVGSHVGDTASVLERSPYRERFAALDEYEQLSVLYSYPVWLCKHYSRAYSPAAAKAIMCAQNESTITCFRANTLKCTRDELIQRAKALGVEALPTPYSPFGLYTSGVNISVLAQLIDDGYMFVQDEASQLAALCVDAKAGETVLDACACPGGKSFSLAMLMEDRGRVISCDLHESKLSLIEHGAQRLGITSVTAHRTDSSKCDEWLEHELASGADRVLCDVPCSGLGVIAKKPEIRYRTSEEIKRLPSIQLNILNNSARYVKAGGVLVYSTCTLNPAENEDNVRSFLAENEAFEPADFELGANDAVLKSQGGMMTLFPHINKTDGFFMAKMKRKL